MVGKNKNGKKRENLPLGAQGYRGQVESEGVKKSGEKGR